MATMRFANIESRLTYFETVFSTIGILPGECPHELVFTGTQNGFQYGSHVQMVSYKRKLSDFDVVFPINMLSLNRVNIHVYFSLEKKHGHGCGSTKYG